MLSTLRFLARLRMGNDEDPSSILPGCSGINNQSSVSSSSSCGTNQSHYIHKSKHHDRYLLNELSALRLDEQLCDVVLLAGHTRIPGHRVVLSACSLYFRAMFMSDLKESRQTEIRMVDIEGRTLQQLVNFCYSGEIKITETSVQYLLPASCLLQMSEIQDACCEFLEKNLDPTNCLGIRAFADTHSCRELVRTADLYTQKNFQEVTASDEFLQLVLEQLLSLISSDELKVGSEEQVYEAAIRWIRYDLPNRRQNLSNVLEHVRLPLCNPKFLVSIISEDALVKADPRARDLVDEAKNYLLLPLERVNMQGPRTRPRKPANHGEVLYAVGGWCSGDAIASVERMDPSRGTPIWEQVLHMKKRRCGVGVAVMDGLLYAVGGHDGNSYLNSVERYDPATNQWDANVAPTTTSRTSVGVTVLDGKLYAVGGQDGVSCLDLVERYDSKANEWCQVAPMSTRRLGVSVSVLKGCLYAVGGSDGQNPLNTVERYDPRLNKWTFMKPMNTPRKHLGTAVYDGKLYAVGGRDDKSELNSAECYDPLTNEWRFIVAMQSRRSGVGLAVVNDQLFAVGGFDGSSYMKSVEVYDPDLKAWRQHSNMNYRRLGGGVGTIKITGNTGHIVENPTLRIERKNKGIQDYATDDVVG